MRINISERRIDMLVEDAEIERRRAAWKRPADKFGRGYGWMYLQHIGQANDGADFDYLETGFGPKVGEPDIY